ncbi:potassium/sodium hyperpolarization-activated cyclic nucleotide-gated channel 2-like isoform X2 [Montipora capricornis]|uniref:potassium/sodium hyperpolarization-activated cyclic nucleotide-gated channel 2-like isoform X2 n=1 Tax=Montipora capricornis TaxID=246305 RepID=UPI0035F1F642
MTEQRSLANHVQEGKSCDSPIDDCHTDPLNCEEILSPRRDQEDSGEICELQNESEHICANKHRISRCSCETENSILSSNYESLQGLQSFGDDGAEDNDPRNENILEIDHREEETTEAFGNATNFEVLRMLELSCSKPLLNGHTASDNDEEIMTEKPQEVISERQNKILTLGRRVRSLFELKRLQCHTAPVHFSRTANASVVITIESEEEDTNVVQNPVESKPRTDTSFSRLKEWLQPMDNKLNMKVFGSRKAMDEEMVRYKKAGWIIHPTSAFRLYWDLMILLLLIVNLFVLPVAIAFFTNDMSPAWIVANVISDGIFLLDIVLNFKTGVLIHGTPNKFILDPKEIAIRYAKGWFIIDLISSFPFDYIVSTASSSQSGRLLSASRALRILRMAKLLSLLRLLRISRLVRKIQQYEEVLNMTRSVIRFVNLISLMLLVAHWNGCMQYLVPVLDDFPDDSWVTIHDLRYKPWTEQYFWALFKALSHMLCIGYGRHPPQNMPETCVTITSMMTGATFYALFIAYSINVIQSMDSPGRSYREKLQQIEEYMSHRRLPVPLRDKITKYYEHRFQGKLFDEERLLHEVSRPLRKSIINHNCRELVRKVPFFSDADPEFVSAIITKLEFEVYLEEDIIIREGEMGTEMYFLKTGVVSVTCEGQASEDLTDGSYFGEICLLTNARRTATIVAKSVCDIYILHAEDFREVVDEYPEMRQLMESVATKRLSRMGKPVDLMTYQSRDILAGKQQQSSLNSVICSSCSYFANAQENMVTPEIIITRADSLNNDITNDNMVT